MKPATNSDSASGRSKGGRFVSAKAEMKNTMNIGNSGSQCQSRIDGAPLTGTEEAELIASGWPPRKKE